MLSEKYTTILFIVSAIDQATTQDLMDNPFNCKRKGYNCERGTCINYGTCDCPADYEGYDCGLATGV